MRISAFWTRLESCEFLIAASRFQQEATRVQNDPYLIHGLPKHQRFTIMYKLDPKRIETRANKLNSFDSRSRADQNAVPRLHARSSSAAVVFRRAALRQSLLAHAFQSRASSELEN
jgi:hypothetical protein